MGLETRIRSRFAGSRAREIAPFYFFPSSTLSLRGTSVPRDLLFSEMPASSLISRDILATWYTRRVIGLKLVTLKDVKFQLVPSASTQEKI